MCTSKTGLPCLFPYFERSPFEPVGYTMELAEIMNPYSDLAYLLLVHSQDLYGVFNMHIAVPASGPGCAFEDPADLELLAVHRTVLVRCNHNDHVTDINVHASCKELWDKDLTLFYPFFTLDDP